MKRGLKVFVSVVSLFVIGLPAFAQPNSKSITSFTMESFDSVGNQNYMVDGESLNWEWGVSASRFIADGFPKTLYTEGCPLSLREIKRGNGVDLKVYGVEVSYNRKGDNQFEVYPVKDGERYEIPFVGNVTQVDFWMWGDCYNYTVEVLLKDCYGKVHALPAGNLFYHGWQNKIVKVPGWLEQQSRYNAGPKHMTFVGFRICTDPEAFVDDFKLFIDEIQYTTNSLSYIYDGYELNEVDFGGSEGSSNDDDVVEVSEK